MSKTSKKNILSYLQGHFRYWTMNSWNRSTSYAANIKVHKFVPNELMDKAFELLDMPDAYDSINMILQEFAEKYDYQYQIGLNGRSSGYLVLYQGGRKKTDYKTRCNCCGKLTWYETEQTCHVSGCSGTLKFLSTPIYQVYTQPGKSLPEDSQDLEEWDYRSLLELYKLVNDFDATVELCKQEFLYFCRNAEVIEEEILIPTKIKTLQLAY